jgi:predicted lysophospholipase L1 biosynthesis ABC-type transport system permease subunit
LWKGKDAARDMEIVGVSRNARYAQLKREIPPVVYIPYDQGYPRRSEMVYALRTAGDPLAYVSSVREIVRQADARMPVSEVRTQKAEIEDSIHQEIVLADLCSTFAMLALTIACVGLYGTMSYTVARRTNEIGIRMALGAGRHKILGMVMRETLLMVAPGVAIGIPAALAATRVLSSLLYNLKPSDPLTFTVSASVMLTVAALAGYLPARRASRVDPMEALRYE